MNNENKYALTIKIIDNKTGETVYTEQCDAIIYGLGRNGGKGCNGVDFRGTVGAALSAIVSAENEKNEVLSKSRELAFAYAITQTGEENNEN